MSLLKRFVLRWLIVLAIFFLIGSMCWLLIGRSEHLATFAIGTYRIHVFAEPAALYEPPGFIYFDIQQSGLQERRFMRVGPERVPAGKFTLITISSNEVIALVLDNEIQMIHEFSSGFTWPGPYTNVTEPQWKMAELLIQQLRMENPEVKCSRQQSYLEELERSKRVSRTSTKN